MVGERTDQTHSLLEHVFDLETETIDANDVRGTECDRSVLISRHAPRLG